MVGSRILTAVNLDEYDSCWVLMAGLFLGSKTLNPKNMLWREKAGRRAVRQV